MLTLTLVLVLQQGQSISPEFISARQGPAFGFEKGARQIMPESVGPLSTPEHPLELLSNKEVTGLVPLQQLPVYAWMNACLCSSPAQSKAHESFLAKIRQPVLTNVHRHDHYNVQTPIRNQGGRATCCVFGITAAMEAMYVREGGGMLDLSEQYTNWLKNETAIAHLDDHSETQTNAALYESLPAIDSGGLGCVGLMHMLSQYRTVTGAQLPYNTSSRYDFPQLNPETIRNNLRGFQWWRPTSATQRDVNALNFSEEEQPASLYSEYRYAIRNYVALEPAEFHNPDTLEKIIDAGYDIPFSMTLYNPAASNPADPRDPVWRHLPSAAPVGGHSMDIIGYDHDLRVFIAKNGWGYVAADPSMYHAEFTDLLRRFPGYVLLSYDCLPDVIEAGVITSVAAPSYNFQQRFIGKWDVKITQVSRGRLISHGILFWRRLPGAMAPLFPPGTPDWRLGDYEASDGRDFRVNAYPIIGPPSTENVRMYIDFDSLGTNFHDMSGFLIAGSIEPFDTGIPVITGTISAAGSERTLFGVRVSDLHFVARRHVGR